MSEILTTDIQNKVAVLTLNRPETLNALSPGLRDELTAALSNCHQDDAIGAIVLTGSGRGFCSGADLSGGPPAPPTAQNEITDEFGWVGRQAMSIYRLDKPVICAVNGVAAGAGMSLATACDMRVGCENSRFKSVFIERNLSPDSGLSFFLPRIVGASRAADMIYTSRTVGADEAYRMGLLDRLVDSNDLVSTAVDIATQMLQWPPLALRMSKRVLQHSQEHDLEAALRYEMVGLGYAGRAKNDAKESRAAFVEKRKPNYTGT
ncbi:MAG: enoyl-CoA hydratase/isomerase family protein [Pseudomonadota bacterium]